VGHFLGYHIFAYSMWLKKELCKIKTDNLTVRQQIDYIQDNAYLRRNISVIVGIKVSLSKLNSTSTVDKAIQQRFNWELEAVWANIIAYIKTFFPSVWLILQRNNLLPKAQVTSTNLLDIITIDSRIQFYRYFTEICKSITYGGVIRFPFDQNSTVINTHHDLLHSCRTTDISGRLFVTNQNRILFLQDWLEKLVASSSLDSYLISCQPTKSPEIVIKREPRTISAIKSSQAQVFPTQEKENSPIKKFSILDTSLSSCNSDFTSFSSYFNQQQSSSSDRFNRIIKFEDSDDSNSGNLSDSSENSIWKPVFQSRKRKRSQNRLNFLSK